MRYVKVAVHVFQKEDPSNPGTIHPSDPGNWQDIPAHKAVIDGWFNHPTDGINSFLANLCEDETVTSPYISDSRLRVVFDAEQDIFFHPDNDAWGIGWYAPEPCNDPQGAGFWTAVGQYALDDVFNVFVTMGSWVDRDTITPSGDTLGMAGMPDEFDCYYPCSGGLTGDMFTCSPSPTMAIFGTFQQFQQNNGQVPMVCGDPYNGNPTLLGRGIVGEMMHILSVDHNGGNFHVDNGNFGDDCDDTPDISDNNLMDCQGGKCNLTQCQLGKAHHFLTSTQPGFERFPDGNGGFTTEGNCAIDESDIIIEDGDDIVWASGREARSNIIVQSGCKLTIRCDLGMPEGGQILVEKGGHLVVDGARIYNNCDGKHWDGIVVLGNKNQQHLPEYQGFCEIKNFATIEGAVIGVRTYVGTPGSSEFGGVVQAENTIFYNCKRRMVEFRADKTSTGGSFAANGESNWFWNCDFLVDGAYQSDFAADFSSMVFLQAVEGIKFRGCRFQNQYPVDFISEGKNGIVSRGASFSVSGICTDIGTAATCNTWIHSRFAGFYRGIHSGKVSTDLMRVSRTKFLDNHFGIYAWNADFAYIVNNEFSVGSTAPLIPPVNGDGAHIGLLLKSSTGFTVEGNVFNLFDGTGTLNPVGIETETAGMQYNEIYRNTFDGLDYANLSNGKNRGDEVDKGLQYLCNTNTGNMFDIAVPQEEEDWGIAENQGSAAVPTGNSHSSQPVEDEGHVLNNAEDIDYFYALNQEPTNTTPPPAVDKVLVVEENQCPAKVPEIDRGFITDTEKQQFITDYYGTTEISVRTSAANSIIRHFLRDSLPGDLDSARYWVANKGDLYSRFTIVDTWLAQGDATAAQLSLNDIPNQIGLEGEAQAEYTEFSKLKNIQIGAMQTGTDETDMVVNNQSTIQEVADAGNYKASAEAQALLNHVLGETYVATTVLPKTSGQQGLMAPPVGTATFSTERYVEAIPNPAGQQTVFHYSLPEGAGQCRIMISAMDGRLVKTFELEDVSGKVSWDFAGMDDGVYLYSLISNDKKLETNRLVILK